MPMKNKYLKKTNNTNLRILFFFISFENKYKKKEYWTFKYEIKDDLGTQ